MIELYNAKNFENARKERMLASGKITADVAEIIENVIKRGDDAVREYTKKFDGCEMEKFELPPSALDDAVSRVGPEFIGVMERAAENIKSFHRRQIRNDFIMTPSEGVILGQRILPLGRVGVYVPGGTAAYPSSVLMNCIPAKLAGVGEIIIVTPPSSGGRDNEGILAAAKIAGVDRVFSIGGAQAIAALAYGTETVPMVDKITGPGNAYVAEAKRQVFGVTGIDMIAGPSDILVIAGKSADPVLVAADMLSQCEHGVDSAAVLITDSTELAHQVDAHIAEQIKDLPRREITQEAVDRNGRIIIVESLDKAFEISNELAPEHLEIFLDDPLKYLDRVQNAGSVFLGKNTPEALGDYYAGSNHTLPTSGAARFSSPLSVDDFIKKSSFTYYTLDALLGAAADVVSFAEKEGLTAHALSVAKRIEKKLS